MDCVLEVIFCGDVNCVVCGGETLEDSSLCRSCSVKIKECFDFSIINYNKKQIKCYSASYYSKVIMELIIRLKYKKDFKSAEILASLMLKTIRRGCIKGDYIAFVPISKASLKKRGYNQSMLLGKIISKETGIEIIDVLKKSKDAKDQIGLSRKERLENIKNSFEFKGNTNIKNKNIILVDDVFTTGATAFWCVDILIKNGAKDVKVLTAAKSKV
ncbi:MAG: ComF family protein [Solirubrobacterales bacterium]